MNDDDNDDGDDGDDDYDGDDEDDGDDGDDDGDEDEDEDDDDDDSIMVFVYRKGHVPAQILSVAYGYFQVRQIIQLHFSLIYFSISVI